MKKFFIVFLILAGVFSAFFYLQKREPRHSYKAGEVEFFSSSPDMIKSKRAQEIAYKYILDEEKKDTNRTEKEIKEDYYPHYSVDNVYAYEYDIDDDGTAEIFAKFGCPSHCGTRSCSFYILKKEKQGYINLASTVWVYTFSYIEPLDTKTEGYRDFQIKENNNTSVAIIKYNKKDNLYHCFKNFTVKEKLRL